MELRGKKINFLGDSITEGHGASGPDKVYVHLIQESAGLAEARNYGISATRIARQVGDLTWDRPGYDYVNTNSFCERFAQMDDDADAVVVFGGTNDWGHGDAPLGTPQDRTPDTFWGACHVLFAGLTAKYPGKPVVVVTPLHRCNELSPRGDCKPQDVGTLKEYVDILRAAAEYYSMPVLDLFREGGLQPAVEEIREKFIPDGLHPNDAGQAIIARKLEAFLRALA